MANDLMRRPLRLPRFEIISLASPAVPVLLSIEPTLLAKRRHRINFWHQRLRLRSPRKVIEMIQFTLSALDWRELFPLTKKRCPKNMSPPRPFRFYQQCQRCLPSRTDTHSTQGLDNNTKKEKR